MVSAGRQHILELIEEFNIHFDDYDQSHWPVNLRKTFENIAFLGQADYESYNDSITFESEERPWRAQTKHRAARITEIATRCLRARKNEAGWRLNLESAILDRFSIEVSCRICRARLWRSELEAADYSSSPAEIEQALQARRKKRAPCACGVHKTQWDSLEQGLNQLFDDRAEEVIHYEERLKEALGGRQKPDRIFGLRRTKVFERLLSERTNENGELIKDSVRCTPFAFYPQPLLFPFLVIEAKSEKTTDSFTSIEAQTAFSIRSLVKLQHDLRNATGIACQSINDPLVWFISYIGENWRVAAAHIEQDKKGVQHYRVSTLWYGSITSKNGALQLLLIIDYIFDWARDRYRINIINQLRNLAASNAPSLTNDSDIFSTSHPVDSWRSRVNLGGISPDSVTQVPSCGIPEVLEAFKCPSGVVRDARFFQARFCALHVSADDLNKLLQSESDISESKQLARDLQRFLLDAVLVDEGTLDALHTIWSKNDSGMASAVTQGRIYFTKICMAAYLTSSWEQEAELTYVAVEASAIDALTKYAPIEQLPHHGDLPFINHDQLLELPKALRHFSSQRDMLLATINQRCLVISSTRRKSNEKMGGTSASPKPTTGTIPSWNVTTECEGQIRHIVLSFYNRCKIEMREPCESFLRHSSCAGERQSTEKETSFWHDHEGKLDRPDFITQDENVVGLDSWSFGSEMCLYLLDGPYDYEKPVLQVTLKMDLLRHFTVLRPGQGSAWGTEWNLRSEKTFGNSYEKVLQIYCAQLLEKWVLAHKAAHAMKLGDNDAAVDVQMQIMMDRETPEIIQGWTDSHGLPRSDIAVVSMMRMRTMICSSHSTVAAQLSFCIDMFEEIRRLKGLMLRMRALATGIAQPSGSRVLRKRVTLTGEDSPRESSGRSRSLWPKKRMRRSIIMRRRDFTIEDADLASAQAPAKKLFVRPSSSRFGEGRLDHKWFEALLGAGYFGSPIVLREEPRLANEDSQTAASAKASPGEATKEGPGA